MPNWTIDQQNAINARGSNILVSAAAGSGKTAVLVERVVKLITDEINSIDIDKLLIVTFTNAAAAEMKNRISTSLSSIIKKDVNNTNAIKQMSLIPNASICTIDSFCINLVREYFFMLDISQDFKILDDSENVLIQENAVNEIIESLYEENKDDFRSLVELLSSTKNDSNLASSIKSIYNYIMSQPFPYEWLKGVADRYNPDIPLDDTMLKDYIFDDISSSVDVAIELINSSKSQLSPDDEIFDDLCHILDSDYNQFNCIKESLNKSFDDLKYSVDNASFVTMSRKNSPVKQILNANREIYKSILTDDIKPLATASSDDYKQDCLYLYPILKLLCVIVQEYGEKMLEMKKELNAYTFSDIEHFAIDLLLKYDNGEIIRTPLANEYEKNYKEILVDEYQDTNTAQDTLFRMLSNGKNRFMVGDVKQSIYRFRLAMPQIFNNKKNTYTIYDSSNSDTRQKIILDNNFRSRKGVCNYANFVFSNIMTKQIGELDYTRDEFLNYASSYKDTDIPSAQIKLINTPDNVDSYEYEAEQVAHMIKDKIASKELIKDGDDYRPIQYGDIAILLRSTKNALSAYIEALSKYGIPVVSNNKTNLFDNNEVAILLSLLRVIDNPMQDIPLLATLMSVFFGYSADDIASAKVNYSSNNLYSSIIQDERFSNFVTSLNRYRRYSSSMNVESLIRQIIAETSYLSIISAMGNAEQRKLNVSKFIDLSKLYDNGENVGLTAFLRYVDSIISSKLSVESAEISHIDDNSVQIMTIHKSKGLEFPVCILANAGHKYNMQELSNQIQINDKFGLGLKVHNEDGLYRYNSLHYSAIKNMNQSAMMSENLRVLYVAITRAKEQFITIISNKNIETHINNLSKKIIDNRIYPIISKHVQNDGDFILLTALLHKDGKFLRDMCERDIIAQECESDLSIDILDSSSEDINKEKEYVPSNQEIIDVLDKKLSFKYDRNELSGFVSKRTASSLDEAIENNSYFALSKPAFLNDEGMTPAEKGTAMHSFMQYCDYDNAKANIENEISRLVDSSFITSEQAISLNREKLNNLFNSDFGKRMFSSDKIYREIKVSSFVPVSKLENTLFDDKVLVQGIADCVFEENGELVLVDYKTDRVKSEDELLDRYKNQVSFYKEAVSKTLSKHVKEVMLYSFWLDKCCIYK